MRPSEAVHDALARLVEYPREGWVDELQRSAAVVGESCPEAAEVLAPFLVFAREHELGDLEERFTRTFDNTDERALEVGWHVFGENYTRGAFMARMRRRMRDCRVEEGNELPDHLSHVLALVARCPEDEASLLVHDLAIPAATKIREALVKRDDPWTAVLDAVLVVLGLHAGEPTPNLSTPCDAVVMPPCGVEGSCHE